MGKLEGLIKWNGKLEDLVAYELNGKWVVRKKGSVSKTRYKKDPSFQRMRESGNEFGCSAKLSAYLRQPWKRFLTTDKDGTLHSRLTQAIFIQLKQSDGPRGQRVFTWNQAGDLFKHIPLTKTGTIANYLHKINVTTNGNQVSFTIPLQRVKQIPEGTTHIKLVLQLNQLHDLQQNNGTYVIPSNHREQIIHESTNFLSSEELSWQETIDLPASSNWTFVFVIQFFQEVNNELHQLKSQPCECVEIIKIN